jgi:hypothetical protein
MDGGEYPKMKREEFKMWFKKKEASPYYTDAQLEALLERGKQQNQAISKLENREKVQAAVEKIPDYLLMAGDLQEVDSPQLYARVNRLNFELAMWLPADLYRKVTLAIAAPQSRQNNILAVIEAARKYLLGENAEDLTQDDIAFHAPGIGKMKEK